MRITVILEFEDSRTLDLQDATILGFQESRIPGFYHAKSLGFKTSGIQDSRSLRFQDR